MTGLTPTPLHALRVSRKLIPAYKLTPNTSIQNKPLFIYHSAFPSKEVSASALESYVKGIGAVVPQWRYTMYSTSHFHSTSHEVLCIASGRAMLCFGHEDNPDTVQQELSKGDVVVIPAGVAHRLLEDLEGGFSMVGCYPPGKQWDMCYGKQGEEKQVSSIKDLGWFDKDPIYGEEGPVLNL